MIRTMCFRDPDERLSFEDAQLLRQLDQAHDERVNELLDVIEGEPTAEQVGAAISQAGRELYSAETEELTYEMDDEADRPITNGFSDKKRARILAAIERFKKPEEPLPF